MREIKFRAWDGARMIDTGTLHKTTRADGYEMWDGDKHEYHQIMQFTGLHDKNGKEIYEGDIVSIPSTCYENPQIEVVEIRVEKDHTHRDAFFECFPFNSYLQSEDCYGTASESEVIGNIYENPELLQK